MQQLNGIEGHVLFIFGHAQQSWGGSGLPCLGCSVGGLIGKWFGRTSRSLGSAYLYHGFVYLWFLKQKEVIGTVVVSVNPKASCLANARIVGVHRDREAGVHSRMRWWYICSWNNRKNECKTHQVPATVGASAFWNNAKPSYLSHAPVLKKDSAHIHFRVIFLHVFERVKQSCAMKWQKKTPLEVIAEL